MLCLMSLEGLFGDAAEVRPRHRVYARYVKRALDIMMVALFLFFFWWLLAGLAFLVRVKLGSPVIFRQLRPGKDEKVFMLYKFRSMTDERDEEGALLSDEDRLTSFGRKLRATSLDELPELFNILRGDMSVVGPRPLLVEYLDYYNDWQRSRHCVRPGLTGLAQCSGRNALSWDERFRLDAEYVLRCSFSLDASILIKTIGAVIKREGISDGESSTMRPFRGSHE